MQISKLKYYLSLLLSLMLFLPFASSAVTTTLAPLPPDVAFEFSAVAINPTQLFVQWNITPGYFLYVKKTVIKLDDNIPADIQYPAGELRRDTARGNFKAYSGLLVIPVVLKSEVPAITLNVDYQGCSQDGFCYPPTSKTVTLNMSANAVGDISTSQPVQQSVTLHNLLTDQNNVQTLFYSQHLSVMLLLFVGLGLLLAFTPCVLPMIPIITSIIVGQQKTASTRKAFLLSLTYVMGMALTYAFAGMIAALFGTSLQIWVQKPVFIIAGTTVLVLLAFSIFELYELNFLRHWQKVVVSWSNKHEGGTYVGVFFMGIISTLLVSPCVTAPLVGVLIYIGNTGNLVLGASALFCIGIGMGIPLLLIGTSAGKWLPKSGSWMEAVRKSFGVLMFAMAIWLLSRILPASVTVVLWGALLVGIAYFVGVYLPQHIGRHTVNRTIGAAIGVTGVLLMLGGVGTLQMIDNLINPQQEVIAANSFTVVKSLASIKEELAMARALKRPVLMDFYADWCDSCVEMEKEVFSKTNVKSALGGFKLLRVDLSDNTEADAEILKYFNVIAPPTVLFFDGKGSEIASKRIVGEVNNPEFLDKLNLFTAVSCNNKMQC